VDSTDTWSWDGRYWTQVSRFGPTRRTGHSMTFDTARSCTVLFGGEHVAGQALRDTWVFDGAEWTQVEDIGPSLRTEHASAFDQNRGRLVLFGGPLRGDGVDGQWARDTWECDGATWTQVEDTGPAKRRSHCLAYDSDRKRTVLFGGLAELTDGSHQVVNDTWGVAVHNAAPNLKVSEHPVVHLAMVYAAIGGGLLDTQQQLDEAQLSTGRRD
jgi:hypothetical protein